MSHPLEQAVAHLASFDMVTSERISEGGDPSPSYRAFQGVLEQATEEELVGLLSYPSAVVRGYVARHVAHELPAHMDKLLPLLRDPSPLTTMSGCMMFECAVSEHVANELAWAGSRELIRRGLRELRSLEPARATLERAVSIMPDDDDTDPGL
jgi:hypothetical protein